MAPAKRSRPAFSPPRPGKSKSKASKSTTTSTAESNKKRGRPSKSTTTSKTAKRPRHDSLSDSASEASEALEASNPSRSRSASPSNASRAARSPSPTHILVEPIPTASDTIPLNLIHHIANTHFTAKDNKTKLSNDALSLLGTYIDTFVREAIVRCAFERGELDGDEGGGSGKGKGAAGSEGWLEVGDLERVGVQLVLDF